MELLGQWAMQRKHDKPKLRDILKIPDSKTVTIMGRGRGGGETHSQTREDSGNVTSKCSVVSWMGSWNKNKGQSLELSS